VEEVLDRGPDPTDVADDETLWWRHERLHRAVMRNPAELRPLFIPQRDEVEAGWLRAPPGGQEAFVKGDELLQGWTAAVMSRRVKDTRPVWVRRYWAKRSRLARL
jgi:hypothetical protein